MRASRYVPVMILALGACASTPTATTPTAATPPAATPPAAAAASPAAGTPPQYVSCRFQTIGSNRFRMGDDVQFVFTVKGGSQWCFDGFGISGTSTEGQSIVDRPAHGTLRLVNQPGALIVGYRPEPGYVGDDRFRLGVPVTFGTAYFVGHVTIAP